MTTTGPHTTRRFGSNFDHGSSGQLAYTNGRLSARLSIVAVVLCGAFSGCSDDDDSAGAGATSGSAGAGQSGNSGQSGNAGASAQAGQAGSSGQSGSSQAGSSQGGSGMTLGDVHEGQYDLGPVEWTGSYNNSCSPYPDQIQTIEGGILAGVGLNYNGNGQLCDACIKITAKTGKSIVARVVTTGETVSPNNTDLSQAAYDALTSGEYPRDMSWQIVGCPDSGNMYYQFQTGANEWWTSLWVRNHRWPLSEVAVKSANHADFAPLTLGNDGTYTDNSGFGAGAFTLRITSLDGQVVIEEFDGFTPGELVQGASQFQ